MSSVSATATGLPACVESHVLHPPPIHPAAAVATPHMSPTRTTGLGAASSHCAANEFEHSLYDYYFVTASRGTEDFAVKELTQDFNATVIAQLQGKVLFRCEKSMPPSRLLSLSSCERLFACAGYQLTNAATARCFDAPIVGALWRAVYTMNWAACINIWETLSLPQAQIGAQEKLTFRPSCKVSGRIFRSVTHESAGACVADALQMKQPSRLVLHLPAPQMEAYVHVNDEHITCGVPLSTKPLSLRPYLKDAALRATTAWCMQRLVTWNNNGAVERHHCIVDPMCGTGTILTQAISDVHRRYKRIGQQGSVISVIGVDNDASQLERAQLNLHETLHFIGRSSAPSSSSSQHHTEQLPSNAPNTDRSVINSDGADLDTIELNPTTVLADCRRTTLQSQCATAIVCDVPFGLQHVIPQQQSMAATTVASKNTTSDLPAPTPVAVSPPETSDNVLAAAGSTRGAETANPDDISTFFSTAIAEWNRILCHHGRFCIMTKHKREVLSACANISNGDVWQVESTHEVQLGATFATIISGFKDVKRSGQ